MRRCREIVTRQGTAHTKLFRQDIDCLIEGKEKTKQKQFFKHRQQRGIVGEKE